MSAEYFHVADAPNPRSIFLEPLTSRAVDFMPPQRPSLGSFVISVGGLVTVYALHLLKARRARKSQESPFQMSGEFRAASAYFSRNSNRFTVDQQLELYGLFKQATIGDAPIDISKSCTVFDPKRKAMNDAWSNKRGKDAESAVKDYMAIIESKCPHWRSGGCQDATSEEETQEKSGWAVGSILRDPIGEDDLDETLIGQVCQLCAEGHKAAVEAALESKPEIISMRDKDGMSCLHWASDRGHGELVHFLLAKGGDPNAVDNCGNTPLHIAAMAGQKDVVRSLLDAKADVALCNNDGESAASIIKIEFPKLILA
jgi:acyl-CoA-binding protein